MRVVVFGGSGVQGAAQVAALSRAGHTPVCVSRSPKPVEIDGKSIETAAADFGDKAATAKAVKGADVIFLNLPSTSFQPTEPVVNGAKVIGEAALAEPSVQLVVFNTSMPVPDSGPEIHSQDDRRHIRDEVLRGMGVPLISIEPVVFLDNLLEGWAYPPIRDSSTVVYCHKPTLDVSWICHDDIASLMMAAMQRPELAGRNFAVGGPETVRLPVLTEKVSRGWGKPLKHEFQTVDDFCDKIQAAMEARSNIDAKPLIDQMHKAYTFYNESPDEPFKIDMSPVLKELPCQLTTIEEWARRHPLPAVN